MTNDAYGNVSPVIISKATLLRVPPLLVEKIGSEKSSQGVLHGIYTSFSVVPVFVVAALMETQLQA